MTYYVIIFAALLFAVILLDYKYQMLRDISTAVRRPYSFGRVQLAWWTIIILSAFCAAIIKSKGAVPDLWESTLILLGISAGTTAAARLIDAPDPPGQLEGRNFFIDILSEDGHVGMHRFQTVVFNFILGIWFINQVVDHLVNYPAICTAGDQVCTDAPFNYIIPDLSMNNLILLGLSSATYAALKTTENKPQPTNNPA